MNNMLLRLLGWKALLIQADSTVSDRWRWIASHMKPGTQRTLDAGCGQGLFAMYCAKSGNQTLGLAYDEAQIQTATYRARLLGLTNIDFQVVDLRQLDQSRDALGVFDQIILLETIEHILDDAKLVADLAALLRPGGLILITAPTADHHPLGGETVSEVEDGGHVRWGYTHEDMVRLLEAQGLQVERRDYLSGIVSQKIAGLQFKLRRFGNALGCLLTLPLRALGFLDDPLSRWLGYPYLSVGVSARKLNL
jgi:SAM-dependent methyltransferase